MNNDNVKTPDTIAPTNKKNRLFFLMNLVIAAVIVSAVLLLKDSSSHYQPGSAFDSAYISVANNESDPEVLKHGIIHTEAARAHAYRSILKQSHGTFIFGLLIAVAFIANAIFIYRLTQNQRQPQRVVA